MMRRAEITRAAIALALAVGFVGATTWAARASDGHSDIGDDYLNDSVKNPRFIEPYAGTDASRYRIGNPYAGYDDRIAASQRGYYVPRRRGRITVRPYRYGDEE